MPDGSRPPIWFALNETRPLAYFAGIWTPKWTSVRKLKEGEVTVDLFGFLTTEPNKLVGTYHPKAMPVILTFRCRSTISDGRSAGRTGFSRFHGGKVK
jgi:putative SOS response-associated peptidase YedK